MVRQCLKRWRQTRQSRTRIPDEVWVSAVELARVYGVSRTARALRLGYYALKQRVEAGECTGATGPEVTPMFVDTPTAPSRIYLGVDLKH
jgi:hypothetical protein